jgi:hypothetical protein
MNIEVSPTATISGAEDGTFVEATVQNHLSCVSRVSGRRIPY